MGISQHARDILNKYFDKIYVITLERAEERHLKVREQLEGLNYEFFYGSDKKDLDYKSLESQGLYDEAKARKINKENLSLGHIGCSLSHRRIYQDMIKNNYKKILIFEDDVVSLKKNLEQVEQIFKELPSDWELVYLGYMLHEKVTQKMIWKQRYYLPLSYLKLIPSSPVEVRNRLPKPYSEHIRIAGEHFCTHAYAITQGCAEKLIDLQTPIAYSADLLLRKAILNNVIRGYLTEPQLFAQEDFFSTATPSYVRE